jgi:hypothetical protein
MNTRRGERILVAWWGTSKHGSPKGGRKVTSVLGRVPWNHVYPFDIDKLTLEKVCRDVISGPSIMHCVYEASQCARELSQQALRDAVHVILDRSEVSASM